MVYGYIRVSTDKQTTENQRFEILRFIDERRLLVDAWVEETISASRPLHERRLSKLLDDLRTQDVIVVTELSRLGRSLLEVTSILHRVMEVDARAYRKGTLRAPATASQQSPCIRLLAVSRDRAVYDLFAHQRGAHSKAIGKVFGLAVLAEATRT